MNYKMPDGSYYEGDMVDGKFQGAGVYHFANGDVYTGQFADDMFEGEGEYRYSTGSVYKGTFSKDLYQGIGTYTYRGDVAEKGKFHQEKRVGKFVQLEKVTGRYNEVLYQNDVSGDDKALAEDEIPEHKKPCFFA